MADCSVDPEWDVGEFYEGMWDNDFLGEEVVDDDVFPSAEDLQKLCLAVKEVFRREDSFPNINPPCLVMSDINGDYNALVSTYANEIKEEQEQLRFCFLGNYIGEGEFMSSLRILCQILGMKASSPYRCQVLRGDRETREGAIEHGFYDELLEVYGDEDGEELFEAFVDVFSWIPCAGTVGTHLFCAHGGISPELKTVDDIRKIPRPLKNPFSNYLATDLLLAEPGDFAEYYRTNPDNNSLVFGKKELSKYLNNNKMIMLIRGTMEKFRFWGQGQLANGKVVCVSTNWKYGRAAAMRISAEGKYGFGMVHNMNIGYFVENGMIMGA